LFPSNMAGNCREIQHDPSRKLLNENGFESNGKRLIADYDKYKGLGGGCRTPATYLSSILDDKSDVPQGPSFEDVNKHIFQLENHNQISTAAGPPTRLKERSTRTTTTLCPKSRERIPASTTAT